VEALAVVRIVKPRIGLGIEFMDVEAPYDDVLFRWVNNSASPLTIFAN